MSKKGDEVGWVRELSMLIRTRTEIRTICRSIHDDETCIDSGRFVSVLEVHSVGVTSQAFICFVEMDFMISALQRPQSGEARATASHDCNSFSALHVLAKRIKKWEF